MAVIAPFRALRFDPARFPDVGPLIAPPYDVISETEREALERRHDRNVVRLDLPRGEGDDKYDAGPRPARPLDRGRDLAAGSAAGYLPLRADLPVSRRAAPRFVRIGLHRPTSASPPLARGWCFPTSTPCRDPSSTGRSWSGPPGPTSPRSSPCTGTPRARPRRCWRRPPARPADVDTVTPDGCRHRLWVVTDRAVIDRLTQLMASKQVMIADGHHRYETMVALRDELRPAGAAPGAGGGRLGPDLLRPGRGSRPAGAADPPPDPRTSRHEVLAGLLGSRRRPAFEVTAGNEAFGGRDRGAPRERGEAAASPSAGASGAGKAPPGCGSGADADLSPAGPAGPAGAGRDRAARAGPGPAAGNRPRGDGQAVLPGLYPRHHRGSRPAWQSGEVQGAFFMNPTKVQPGARGLRGGLRASPEVDLFPAQAGHRAGHVAHRPGPAEGQGVSRPL